MVEVSEVERVTVQRLANHLKDLNFLLDRPQDARRGHIAIEPYENGGFTLYELQADGDHKTIFFSQSTREMNAFLEGMKYMSNFRVQI
jgi:hypothetical protein